MSADARQIGEWWQRWPRAKIGLPLAPNRLLGTDVDNLDLLASIEREYGPLPATVEQSTGRDGGRDLLYHADEPIRSGPGFEINGIGTQIVLAPSLHPSGRPY